MTPEELFASVEESAQVVAFLTGFKQQFVNAGWSNDGAEDLVIAIVNHAPAPRPATPPQ